MCVWVKEVPLEMSNLGSLGHESCGAPRSRHSFIACSRQVAHTTAGKKAPNDKIQMISPVCAAAFSVVHPNLTRTRHHVTGLFFEGHSGGEGPLAHLV